MGLEEDEKQAGANPPSRLPALGSAQSAPASALPASESLRGWEKKSEEASKNRDSSSNSFAAARGAFIRGRSDPVFRQVASYYADRGHDEAQRAREAQSEASDHLVAAQSTENYVDLHHVPVHDGIRIALSQAEMWWDGLGPGSREAMAKRTPLIIVTGKGRHSASGVSKLRQDVGAALKREGWKFSVEEGRFLVKGKF